MSYPLIISFANVTKNGAKPHFRSRSRPSAALREAIQGANMHTAGERSFAPAVLALVLGSAHLPTQAGWLRKEYLTAPKPGQVRLELYDKVVHAVYYTTHTYTQLLTRALACTRGSCARVGEPPALARAKKFVATEQKSAKWNCGGVCPSWREV